MKRPPRIFTLLAFVAVAWSGFAIYETLLKKQANEKKIEEYRQRLSLNKETNQSLEVSKRSSRLQSAPSQ